MGVGGLDGEDDASLFGLDELEAEQERDGRRGQLTGGDRAQPAEPVELGEAECGLDGVVVDRVDSAPMLVVASPFSVEAGPRVHAASRSIDGAGSGSAGLGGSSAGAIAASQGESDSIVTIGPGTS